MGVHGLWPLLHPVARPVALETMGGKKLAIDSSIWLYQFQIAMRDKDGRALDNAHILGFLRRICKLLFYGIKPVFVFDGGAPLIKKIAISNRKNRKQGAKESAARTAEKLLAAQLRAAAVAQAQKDAETRETRNVPEENTNYLDEDFGIVPLGAPERTRRRNSQPVQPAEASVGEQTEITPPKKRKYVHKDQYALPAIDEPLANRAQRSDPRLATEAELRSFIEDMRPEDFDMDSEFFANLPTEVKYEIIGDLRIKSRQSNYRRVEAMKNAPTPLDFSKAQILGVSRRNVLTQKLLTVTDSLSRVQPMLPNRIAGERNREYVLIKNDSNDGAGYILGIRNDGNSLSSPVKIDATTSEESDVEKTTTDEEFEEVQIPKSTPKRSTSPEARRRRDMAIEAIKQRYSPVKAIPNPEDDSAWVDDVPALPPQQPLFLNTDSENPGLPDEVFSQIKSAIREADEEEDVQQAIDASRADMDRQREAAQADDGEESDVSFDEVETEEPAFDVSISRRKSHQQAPRYAADSDDETRLATPVAKPTVGTAMDSRPFKRNGDSSASLANQWENAKPASNLLPENQQQPINISSSEDESAARPKNAESKTKARGLTIDIPSTAFRPPSPEKEQVRTPRPDLTDAQAERDIHPQRVAKHDGVIERDFAPLSPQSPASPPSTTQLLARKVSPSPKSASPVRPSLMTRTLSSHSQAGRSPSLEFQMPDPSDIVSWNGSAADAAAMTQAKLSILEEGSTKLPMESPLELDKGDLQAEVQAGDVESTVRPNAAVEAAKRTASPEVFYEWSPSPEPVGRKRPNDPTLLDPDDPNYIPPDTTFPDPEEDLSDDEDDEHVANLTSEQKEYAKFLSELKNKDLDEMEYEVQNELRVLNEQNKKDKKMADDITVQMSKDIQTMLRVLGLPYVIAPMEAEAQCAELLSRSLVDGVITDDNDVFLFGATRVYKNMFNQNKYVECYLASDIDRELALDREKLIRLAHFLGSDYCDGLPGVGPVLGMELMAEFPGSNGLAEFRNWWLKIQRGRDGPSDHDTAFKRKFKRSKRELFVDEQWPNPEVAKAYRNPQVDDSDEQFAWGIPDLDAMRDYLKEHIGWGPGKVDELLLPIIKRMTGRATGGAVNQATISNFFDVSGGTGRFAPMANKGYQSKRLQAVVKAWRQSQQKLEKEEEEEEEEEEDEAAVSKASDAENETGARNGKARPSASRRGSKQKTSASSSRRSSGRQSSQAGASSDSDANFHDELEAKLAKMGVKRRREAPVGSDRVIKPAKRSKKEKKRKASKIRESSALFAPESDQEEKSISQPPPPKKSKKKTRKTVADGSDEYEQ